MSGLYYLVFGIAILVVIGWCWNNDKGSDEDGSKGLLAIRPSGQKKQGTDLSGRRT